MASFKGKEIYSIDSKGRVNIPVKMRKSIPEDAGNTLVVMRGLDKCIFVYPLNDWEERQEKKLKDDELINFTNYHPPRPKFLHKNTLFPIYNKTIFYFYIKMLKNNKKNKKCTSI